MKNISVFFEKNALKQIFNNSVVYINRISILEPQIQSLARPKGCGKMGL